MFGFADIDGDDVTSLDLITLDIADPARVGIPMTAARPLVTSEMAGGALESKPQTESEDKKMGEENKNGEGGGVATLLLNQRHEKEISELNAKINERDAQIAELSPFRARQTSIAELLKLPADADVVEAVRKLQAEHATMAKEARDLLGAALDAQIAEKVKPEAVRPLVKELVQARSPLTMDALTKGLDEVLASESTKALLKAHLQAEMGDPQKINGQQRQDGGGEAEPPFRVPPGRA